MGENTLSRISFWLRPCQKQNYFYEVSSIICMPVLHIACCSNVSLRSLNTNLQLLNAWTRVFDYVRKPRSCLSYSFMFEATIRIFVSIYTLVSYFHISSLRQIIFYCTSLHRRLMNVLINFYILNLERYMYERLLLKIYRPTI